MYLKIKAKFLFQEQLKKKEVFFPNESHLDWVPIYQGVTNMILIQPIDPLKALDSLPYGLEYIGEHIIRLERGCKVLHMYAYGFELSSSFIIKPK